MPSTTSPFKLGVCGEFDALDSNTSPERWMNRKLISTAVKACSSEVLTRSVSYGEAKLPHSIRSRDGTEPVRLKNTSRLHMGG